MGPFSPSPAQLPIALLEGHGRRRSPNSHPDPLLSSSNHSRGFHLRHLSLCAQTCIGISNLFSGKDLGSGLSTMWRTVRVASVGVHPQPGWPDLLSYSMSCRTCQKGFCIGVSWKDKASSPLSSVASVKRQLASHLLLAYPPHPPSAPSLPLLFLQSSPLFQKD